jgi:hypothetical protein
MKLDYKFNMDFEFIDLNDHITIGKISKFN